MHNVSDEDWSDCADAYDHKVLFFAVHLRYMDPGGTKKGGKHRMISGKIHDA